MLITAEGYWKDDNAPIHATCAVGLEIHPDDENIFYYFAEGEQIVGDHGDFIIERLEG